jgi:hypothetical protein
LHLVRDNAKDRTIRSSNPGGIMTIRRALSFVLVVLLATACGGSDDPNPPPSDAGAEPGDGGTNGGTDGGADGGADGGTNGGTGDGGTNDGTGDGGTNGGTGDGGTNGGTGDGGTNGGTDGGVVTSKLTIQGRVIDAPAAQAEITATVGPESYGTTADSEGRFSLDIVRPQTAPASSWVILTARATGSLPVVLKASLGEIGQLVTAAGADGVLTRQEHNNAYLTHLTTAQYALLSEANGGTPPAASAEQRAAEKEVDSGRLLEKAAVLKLVTTDPARYPLPAGTSSTLALVQNLEAYRRFVTQHSAAVEAAQAPLVADTDTVALFRSADVPSAYYLVDGVREGFMPRGGSKLVLRPAGSGDYLDKQGKHPFTWSLSSGVLVLSFSPPLIEKSYPYLEQCPDQGQVETTFNIIEHRYKLIADGASVEQAHLTRLGLTTYAQCEDGTQIPSSSETQTSSTPLRNADLQPALSLTAAQFAGVSWGMDQYFQYGDAEQVGLVTDLVTFAGNATGSSRRSGATFTWQVSNGKLVLTYPDGAKHQVEWVESLPPIQEFFSERTDSTGRVLSASYNGAIARRPAAAFTPGLLITAAGTYWQTGVNSWRTAWWQGDELNWPFRFGFDLRAASAADRIEFTTEPDFDDGDTVPNEKFVMRLPYTWTELDAQTLRLDSTALCNGEPCRRRHWWLLDVSPTNQRFYVIEDLLFRFNSTPAGTYLFQGDPRWNFYEKWSVPPGDVYGP